MFITDYGIEYLAGKPAGGLSDANELEPAEIDTVAVGTGDNPMPQTKGQNGSNQLTDEVYRATAPSNEVVFDRSDNDSTIVTMGIELVHGLQLPLGIDISEIALIVSDPQVTTDTNGVLLNQIVVYYDYGTPVTVGGTDDDPGDASATTLTLPMDADRVE